jgi:hypothetical protein
MVLCLTMNIRRPRDTITTTDDLNVAPTTITKQMKAILLSNLITIDVMLFHQGGITQADTEITNVCTQISTHKRKRSRRLVGKSKIQRRKFRQRFNSYKSILENNVVVNLSSYKLNLHELSVINKGLGFVPYHLRIPFNSLDKYNNNILIVYSPRR